MIDMTIFTKIKEKLPFLPFFAKNNKVTPEGASEDISETENKPNRDELVSDNQAIKSNQYNLLLLILAIGTIVVLIIISILQEKTRHKATINDNATNSKPKVEVAGESLDPEKMWRNHFEDLLNENKRKFDERLKLAETNFNEVEQKLQEATKLEMAKMQAQLSFAKKELISATEELKRIRQIYEEREQGRKQANYYNSDGNISAIDLSSEMEINFDQPKDARIYIPETSYVSGYLLGGLAVSTALNTPDENASPVVIRLTERGNLPKNFNLDISTCRILGSSYGDLSSERAIIRLEKMVCIDPVTELVTTSNIAGTVHGPDGMNGIKGRIVATSSKHIKNALIGGVISGLSQSAKGQDSMTLTNLGAVASTKKGFNDMVTGGVLTGASNAGEKIADYYLRMAESMSPILTIPGGVKVDVIFMKGFFIGELTTHKKIARERRDERRQENLANKKYGE